MKMLKTENQKPKSLILETSKADTHASYGQINLACMSLSKNEDLNQNILRELLRGLVYDFDLIAEGTKWNDAKLDKISLSSLDCDRLINSKDGTYTSTLPKSFKKPNEDLLKSKKAATKKKASSKTPTKSKTSKGEIDELLSMLGITRDDVKNIKANAKKTTSKKRV